MEIYIGGRNVRDPKSYIITRLTRSKKATSRHLAYNAGPGQKIYTRTSELTMQPFNLIYIHQPRLTFMLLAERSSPTTMHAPVA